jgi:zinc transport system substrate-binding protein
VKISIHQRTLTLLVMSVVAFPLFAQVDVLASIRPLGLLAEAVVGDRGVVSVLLPNGASDHHYQLRYSDRKRLNEANIVLWIGEDLEKFLVKPISQRQQNTVTVSLLPGLQWPVTQPGQAHDHHLGKNPHLWLNPLNNLVIIDNLVANLSQLDQTNAAAYRQNGNDLKAELQRLDKRLIQQLQPILTRGFIVNHPAYDHFVEHYGLTQIAVIKQSPENSSGARHLMKLREEKKIHCVFGDRGYRSDIAQQLAVDLKVPIAYLDPLGYSLTDNASLPMLIQRTAEIFIECLAKDHVGAHKPENSS